MWRVFVASLLLLAVGCAAQSNSTASSGFLADEIPLEVSTAIPSGILRSKTVSVSGQQALTIVFSRPVIALGSDFGFEQLPPELVPFTLNPAIPGRGRWVTTFIYRFDTDGPFATDLDIQFRWNVNLMTYDGVPLTLETSETVILRTPTLGGFIRTVRSAAAQKATDNNWSPTVGIRSRDILPEVPPDGAIELSFSAPVSLAVLRENLRIRDETNDVMTSIQPIITPCRSFASVVDGESKCANVTLDGDLEMGIRYSLYLEEGLDYGKASGPLRNTFSRTFGGLREFYFPFFDLEEQTISTPFFKIYLPHGLADDVDIADIPISIVDSNEEDVTFNLTKITKSVLFIEGPFFPLMNYTVRVGASLEIRDGFGLPLLGSGANLRGGNIISEFRGLTPAAFPPYAIFEANEDWGRLAVTFAKGFEDSDRSLCAGGSFLDVWEISQQEAALPILGGSSRTSYADQLGPPTTTLISDRVDPIATLSTLDVTPLLESSGVIATQYCRFERFTGAIFSETTFQVSVITYSSPSETESTTRAWVTSMITGKPIQDANVFLLRRMSSSRRENPVLVGEGRTNRYGVASIPTPEDTGLITAVVRQGSNFVYVPNIDIRTGGQRTYEDSIVLDRALVRPGETLHIKGYVMERMGTTFQPATRLRTTRVIVSPSIDGKSSFAVKLNEEFGSYELQIDVPEDADLVRYSVAFRARFRRDSFSGEFAFFTVGDPRLPTVELVVDTPFFVGPRDQIPVNVQVSSFIGSAVGGSNITGDWRISDFRRSDEDEPLEGEFTITTDDNGNGTAIIDLAQFAVPPSLGNVARISLQFVGPTSELIEESENVRIAAADLDVDIKRTVNTEIPGQEFGAKLVVTDLQGDPLTEENSVDSAKISLMKIPEEMDGNGNVQTDALESFDGEIVASCVYVVGSDEYCDFVIPEIGEFVLEGCVTQGEVQLCHRNVIGKTEAEWEDRPLSRFLSIGFTDLTPGELKVGDPKQILVENPYSNAWILVSYGNINQFEQQIRTLPSGRFTIEIDIPSFCEFDCGMSLVVAIPRQTTGLAANPTVPVSKLFDTALPHTVTYTGNIEVAPTGPTEVQVNITFPDARMDDGAAIAGPGENTTIEVQLDRNKRTEVTIIAVDRAVLDLIPYPLQDVGRDFLIDLGTSFIHTLINAYLTPPQAIQVLIDNFNSRKDLDPWFSLDYELDDRFSVDRSLEEYIDDRSRFITINFFGASLVLKKSTATTTTFSAVSSAVRTSSFASVEVASDGVVELLSGDAQGQSASVPAIQVRSTASDPSIERDVRLESEFQTTPLFTTDIGEDGILRVNFTAPPNLGTFIVRAYAASGTGLFGSAESEIIVRREISLTPSVPRFARVGDIFEAGAVVTASGSTIVPISLTAEADGPLEFIVSTSQIVQVGGDGQEEARFLVRATAIGTVNFTLFADDGLGNTDALQVEIPVEGLQEAVTVGTSFVVQGQDNGTFTEGLALPLAVPGSGDVMIAAGVGRQPAVFAIANQIIFRNVNFTCPFDADLTVASAVLPGIVNPYSPWNPDPEVVSPALFREINAIVPRFEQAVELLAEDGDFTSRRLGLRYFVQCPDRPFIEQRNPSIFQNAVGVILVNNAEDNLRNHELEEVQTAAKDLFDARNIWSGVLGATLERDAIEVREDFDIPISLHTVALARAALGPDWEPDTSDETIIEDLSLERLSGSFERLDLESQAYYILTRLAQMNGSSHPDISLALQTWTDLLRVTGRTAYISAFPGSTSPASNLANALIFLAFTRAGEEGQLIPRLGTYLANPLSDQYGLTFYGSFAQSIAMIALVEFDVSRGSAQPDLQFEAVTGNVTLIEALFTNETAPVATAVIPWDDLPRSPGPINVRAIGEGEAFVAITLNFIPAELLPFPSYRGIYVERSIQLEGGEDGDGPGLLVVPQGMVVTVKVQFMTPDALDETTVRVLMPAGLEPIDPNISPSGGRSRFFCPIPFFSFFRFFYVRCPIQETRPSVVTFTYDSVRAGTSSVSFRAVAATVGNYTLPPTRVFATQQPEVTGLSSAGRFRVCSGPGCAPVFLDPSPAPINCPDDCNDSGSCNLSDGSCLCFSGFTGPSCEAPIETVA